MTLYKKEFTLHLYQVSKHIHYFVQCPSTSILVFFFKKVYHLFAKTIFVTHVKGWVPSAAEETLSPIFICFLQGREHDAERNPTLMVAVHMLILQRLISDCTAHKRFGTLTFCKECEGRNFLWTSHWKFSVGKLILHWQQRFDTGRKRGIKIVRVFCSIQGFGPECIPGLKRPILKRAVFRCISAIYKSLVFL